jgi:anti-sigma regulatory factor (Ser/Thr protein kinase)
MLPIALFTPATTANTRLAAHLVRQTCEALGYAPRQAARVELAVCEALNNVAEHAYAGHRGGVDIEMSEALPFSRHLAVTLRYGGTAPPSEAPLATSAEAGCFRELRFRDGELHLIEHEIPLRSYRPGEHKESGRGLALVHSIAEAVFARTEGQVHTLTLIFTPHATDPTV